ncbi:MAG: pyruvate dehydrogenase E2 component (dihydrolipoamide acetyltransferase) [Halobacteriales archaeon]|jgi:pyruvate dehydrogenase E2 component (dihydrolipoamide acetyltransferase)
MVREFKLPDVGEGVAEGELVQWLVESGDPVTEDQPVAEVETDKALVEVPSPVNGTVAELRAEEGEIVPVGDVIIVFQEEGEADADEAVPSAEPETTSTESETETDAEPGTDGEEPPSPEGRVFAAPSARRLARELGVDIATVQGSGPSGRVTESDVRAHAEEGTTETVAAEPGSGTEAANADVEADAAESETETAAAETTAHQVESADREKTLAAPSTRRIADEEGVDIDAVPATEERDGQAFVTPEAVREYAKAQQAAQAADTEALAKREETGPATREPADVPDTVEAVEGGTTTEPYRGVRRTIGEAMKESKYTAPHVTHHDEVDVTELVETREELKAAAEEQGIRLTYLPFVMKAAVAALKEYPLVNAALDEENEEIVKHHYYNIGVATATDVGLMVPVVENVDRKGLLQVASQMNERVQKARDRSISLEEMQGGTFSVTNIGGIGGEYATPIINYPESAILAIGEIKKKPRVVEVEGEERIEPRHMLTLSLSFDHRIVDGAIGAQFTNEIKKYLENPKLLLLE